MIRWSYLVPRLAILAAALAAVWLGLDPLLRWLLVATGQRIVEAKVEIGRLHASVLNPELRLRDVAVANPREPMKNLVEAREIVLGLEGDSLLRKKWVVREGRISGMRFGTPRQTSGAIDPNKPLIDLFDRGDVEAIGRRVADYGEQWLAEIGDLLAQEAIKQLETFESVRLARELSVRWPAEYERMEQRAESLKRRAEELREFFQGDRDPKQLARQPKNLLKDPDALRRAAQDLDRLQDEIAEFRAEVDRLGKQALRDKASIQTARQHDLDRIRRTFRAENLRPENLSEYLLGPETGRRVVTAARWVNWARQHWPERVNDSEPVRGRGIDILFAGVRQRPDFVVQKLVLEGEAEIDDERFQFEGMARDLTSQPALYGKPAALSLDLRGKIAVHVEATIDRTQPVAKEHVVVRCPAIPEAPRALGKPEQFAVIVSPGNTKITAELDLAGEDLAGRIVVRQEPVRLVPQLPPKLGERLEGNLQTAFAEIRSIEVRADLSGKLRQPQWRLESNLGPQIAQSLNGFFQRELDARREELIACVQQHVDRQWASLEQKFQARQDALVKKLNLSAGEIEQVRQLVAQRVPGAEQLLQKNLPEELLRKNLPKEVPWRF